MILMRNDIGRVSKESLSVKDLAGRGLVKVTFSS